MLSVCARLLAAVSLVLVMCRTSAAEPARAGFEVTALAVAPTVAEGPSEPAAGLSVNAAGDAAFTSRHAGKEILSLRYDGVGMTVPVLIAGDPLMGGKLAHMVVMPTSLDAYRQIHFYAVLEDGRAGFFRARPIPKATFIDPTWGYRDRPTTFRLVGDGFTPGIQVRFGEAFAGLVSVISPTELTGTVPARNEAGLVTVTVQRPGGEPQKLGAPFELRDPPVSGCRGLWPDHRPPVATASVLSGDWMLFWVMIGALGARRRAQHSATVALRDAPRSPPSACEARPDADALRASTRGETARSPRYGSAAPRRGPTTRRP